MLELLREGTAPAAIVLGRADAILALGAVVGQELGYAPISIVELSPEALGGVADGDIVRIDEDGATFLG
jgi:predicted aconitase with swiveling domain